MGTNMDISSLKVSTEELKAQSGEVTNFIQVLQDRLESIEHNIQETMCYWEGEANEAAIVQYKARKNELNDIIHRFREHVTDLEQIAGVYEQTEQTAEKIASGLPSNIIS